MREAALDAARELHERRDAHRRSSFIVDVLLGGQDGLVNVLGVVLGVSAATGSVRVVLAAGLAAAFAESVSMAAVAYTSATARGELYESERAREQRHVRRVPEIERDEIRRMYERKGFSGELLESIVATITSNPDVWIAEMMESEHKLSPVDVRDSRQSALVVGVASLVGSLVPLAPFLILRMAYATWASVALAAGVLFGFGVYKARVTVGSPLRGGLELAIIGVASAVAGYFAGVIAGAPAVP